MPKISVHNSQETLTNQAPSVNRNISQEGITGQNIAQVGGAVQDISFKAYDAFKKADELRQKTEASVEYTNEYAKLSEDILNDNESDFDTLYKKSISGLEKIRSQSASKIKDKNARLEFDSQVQMQNVKAVSEFRTQLRKKQIQKGVVALDQSLTQSENSFASSGNPNHINYAVSQLESFKKAGYITPEEHLKKVKELNKSALFSEFQRNPDRVFEQLDSASGFAQALDPEERAKTKHSLLKLQEKTRKESQQAMKLVEDETERDVALRLTKGEVNQTDLDELLKGTTDDQGNPRRISRTYYEAASKSLLEPFNDPDISSDEKLNKYAELVTEYQKLNRKEVEGQSGFKKDFKIATGNSVEQIQSFRSKVAEATRYLTREEAKDFYEATQSNLSDSLNPKASAFQQFIDYSKNWGVGNLPLVYTARSFFKEIKGKNLTEDQTMEVAKKVIEKDQKLRNPNRSKYDLGQVITHRNRSYKVVGFDKDGEPLLDEAK